MPYEGSISRLSKTQAFEMRPKHRTFERTPQRQCQESISQQLTISPSNKHVSKSSHFQRQGQVNGGSTRQALHLSTELDRYHNTSEDVQPEAISPIHFAKSQSVAVSDRPSFTRKVPNEDASRPNNPHPIPRTSRTSALTKLLREHENNNVSQPRSARRQPASTDNSQLRHTHAAMRGSPTSSRTLDPPDLAHKPGRQQRLDTPDDQYRLPESLSSSSSPSMHPSMPDSPMSFSPSPSPVLSPRLSHSSSTSGLWMKGTFTGLNDQDDM